MDHLPADVTSHEDDGEECGRSMTPVVVGIVLAAFGGVMFYRALYLEPSAALVITNTEVREVPNTMKVIGGAAMFVGGATLAFLAARRKR